MFPWRQCYSLRYSGQERKRIYEPDDDEYESMDAKRDRGDGYDIIDVIDTFIGWFITKFYTNILMAK